MVIFPLNSAKNGSWYSIIISSPITGIIANFLKDLLFLLVNAPLLCVLLELYTNNLAPDGISYSLKINPMEYAFLDRIPTNQIFVPSSSIFHVPYSPGDIFTSKVLAY